MNKKFSTLVASLLLAGAWTTANADIVPVGVPVVGGSYFIGTAVDDAANKITNMVSSSSLSIADNSAFSSATEAFKFVDTGDGDGSFYLFNGTYYLALDASSASANYIFLASANTSAFKFKLSGDKLVLVGGQGSTFPLNAEVCLTHNNRIALTYNNSPYTGTALAFAEWNEDVVLGAAFGNQTVALQSSFAADEYYFISGNGTTLVKGKADGTIETTSTAASALIASDLDAHLWKISTGKTADGKTTYTFTNKASQKVAVVNSISAFIVEGTTGSFKLHLTKDDNGLDDNFALSAGATTTDFGIYKSPIVDVTAGYLNDLLGEGFGMTISQGDAEIDGMEAFNGKLEAVATPSQTSFLLKNGDKYIALKKDANEWSLSNVGSQKRGDKFSLVDDKVKNDATEWAKYLTQFTFKRYAGVDNKVVKTVSVSDGTTTKEVYVMQLGAEDYILTATQGALSVGETYPTIVLELSNIVNVSRDALLGKFWNIDFDLTAKEVAEKGTSYANANRYKVNGALAMLDGVADFVPVSSVRDTFPEAQWFVAADVTTGAANSLTQFSLMNRESGDVITNVVLRKYQDENGDIVPNEYVVESVASGEKLAKGDKLKFSQWVPTEFDGYMSGITENYLNNNKFYMGQKHAIAGNTNVYFAENHSDSHKLGAVTDKEGKATVWNIEFAKVTKDAKLIPDTLKIERNFAKVNAAGNGLAAGDKTTLKILKYQFKNRSNNEYIAYRADGFNFYVLGKEDEKIGYEKEEGGNFALKMQPDGTYNIIQLAASQYEKNQKIRVANSELDGFGELINMPMYATDDNSIMVVEKYDAPEYHKITNHIWGDTITLARADNPDQMLYEQFSAEATNILKDTTSFLNIENINDPKFKELNAAIFADTAYINRGTEADPNTCYQYLLAVRQSYGYHKENCNNPAHEPEFSDQIDTVYGDFLVNLIDTANVWGANNIHVNPYIDRSEAGEEYARLAFVSGFHTNDTLYIVKAEGDTVKLGMDTPDFNVAKFAFRYVSEKDKTFKIQTQFKNYIPTEDLEDEDLEPSNEGYLKWINGALVVIKGFEYGDVFTISEGVDQKPVANESIDAVSEVSVVAIDGAVIVKGAEGKNVTITNVLGQTVANTVVTSNEATIATPTGVVFVSVEGEAAIKAIVK